MRIKEIGIALPTGNIMVFMENRVDGDDTVSKLELNDAHDLLDVYYESGVRKTFPEPGIVWYGTTSFNVIEGGGKTS